MNREQLEKLRQPIPEATLAALKLCKGVDFSEHVVEDEHGAYSTGLFRWKGKDILVTIDGGKWHLSASTNHPIGYYEMKEMRYEFLPDGIQAAQIFPPREEFVNVHDNCYHLYEIDGSEDIGILAIEMPTYDELTEQSAEPVTGSDLKFQYFETARTVCKSMIEAMRADGLTKDDLPQLLHDVCKFVVLTEANIDKESALFVLDRFTRLTTDLSVVMMRIIRHQAEEMDKEG
jgi:hypothetical protein